MWNYPFDPNEIEGQDNHSDFADAFIIIVCGIAVAYFGIRMVAAIF